MANINNFERNKCIDALRGIAILSVLLLHINIQIPFNETYFGSIMPKPLYKICFMSGYYGVCIFFVISGFLITNSTMNKWGELYNVDVPGFYKLRFARIMPLLIVLLAILSILHLADISGYVIDPDKTSLGHALFAAITFHINWLEIRVGYLPASWDILWSLSIEEIFYLFFPLICVVVRQDRNLGILLVLFLIISPLARTICLSENELGDRNNLAYADSMLLGCIAAIVAKRVKMSKPRLKALSLIGWGLFLFIMLFRKVVYHLGLTSSGINVSLLSLGTALILIWMQNFISNASANPSKKIGFIQLLGQYSYEIYLTHVFIVLTH
jgi:peptidoglycan/LPS O-acetylase OafA/YrhL